MRTHLGWLLAAGLVCGVAGCSGGPRGVESAEREIKRYAHVGDVEALAEWVAYSSWGLTKLPPDYVLARLLRREDVPAIDQAFDRVVAGDTPAARAALVRALELDFVHRADTSSLDLLGTELGERFRSFDWHAQDYPGGDEGPNEVYAGTLADALDGVTPERRANRAAVAVIVRGEATDAIWEYMLGQWRAVPGEVRGRGGQAGENWKLNRHAVGAYVAMRAAAAADGVDLTILSGHRDPKRAAANAARVGNSFAVASFSSHSLGLAIDFELPRPDGDTGGVAVSAEDAADIARAAGQEEADASGGADDSSEDDNATSGGRFRLTTRPMSAVVDMRRSPVHKWLHLYGRRFGWYPFQHEPWHWEYNPPGFRAVFFEDFPGGAPPRGLAEPGAE